jgi:sialate O-acetylesterase
MNIKLFFIAILVGTNLLFSGCNSTPDKAQNRETIAPAENITLNPLFTNHMVLQRNRPIKIYGTSNPRQLIKVTLGENSVKTVSNLTGTWSAELPALKAGGPYSLTVQGKENIVLTDILIGDVWVCSGQSNMEWPVKRVSNAVNEIKVATYPKLRLFTAVRNTSPQPLEQLAKSSGWQLCTPDTVPNFSAAAYFFGRKLQQKLNIPIGLLHSSWGGTPAEAWTSMEMLQTLPSLQMRINRIPKVSKKKQQLIAEYRRISALRELGIKKIEKIEADQDYGRKMADPELDDAKWQSMQLPTIWEKAGLPGYDGIVWFRKNVDIPVAWAGKTLTLKLGAIDEVDITYFNGIKVGGMGSMKNRVSNYWQEPRNYTVPGHLVKPGKNVITSMVIDVLGAGGLWGGKQPEMSLRLANMESKKIDLSGSWQYFAEPAVNIPPQPRNPNRLQGNPGFLFNAMINPLVKFPITGAIWYQGENNASRAHQYQRLFPAMIQDWRIRWQQGDFPFYFVQLANYHARKPAPGNSTWAELREAQLMTLRLPNTGMAVIIDIGEAKNIHPKNKQDVGKRLALNALASHYKQPVAPCGPIFAKMVIKQEHAMLRFSHTGSGLMAKGSNGKLKGFTIAGKDKKFFNADAEIENGKVVVWSNKVKQPVAVRYGWADNPECNLYNKEQLPATPFRTDNWPGVTVGNR